MDDYTHQRVFINANTDKLINMTATDAPINGGNRKVCKPMFLNTLGLKKGVADIAIQKRYNENVGS